MTVLSTQIVTLVTVSVIPKKVFYFNTVCMKIKSWKRI
uniref:Uncharacterized protein n=1 Tax=Anguilla anguilla TaxID=7936 RepID=A0A0E9TAA0_ANGAN